MSGVPAGVAAALDAGRVRGSYPYAPVKPAGVSGIGGSDQYVTVPASVLYAGLEGRAKSMPVDGREYERALVPLRNPSDALGLARDLLKYHRAYGLTDTRDQQTAYDAHVAAQSVLGEWRRSGKTTLHLYGTGPEPYSPNARIAQRTEIPPLPPRDHWMALQKEMRDLQDSLVHVDALVPPMRKPSMRQGTWSKRTPSEQSEPAMLPPRPSVPLDADGDPIQSEKIYYVADKMLKCGKCKVKILPTSNYCHHCATRVKVSCAACGEETRCPAAACAHCGQMLPKEKQRGRASIASPATSSIYNPPASELRVPDAMTVDLEMDKNEPETIPDPSSPAWYDGPPVKMDTENEKEREREKEKEAKKNKEDEEEARFKEILEEEEQQEKGKKEDKPIEKEVQENEKENVKEEETEKEKEKKKEEDKEEVLNAALEEKEDELSIEEEKKDKKGKKKKEKKSKEDAGEDKKEPEDDEESKEEKKDKKGKNKDKDADDDKKEKEEPKEEKKDKKGKKGKNKDKDKELEDDEEPKEEKKDKKDKKVKNKDKGDVLRDDKIEDPHSAKTVSKGSPASKKNTAVDLDNQVASIDDL